MNKNDCKYERVSNVGVGLILLLIGLGLTVVGLAVLPVIGLIVAVPVLVLGVIFMVSPRSKACQVIADRTRKAISS
jgi:hypothetical protein